MESQAKWDQSAKQLCFRTRRHPEQSVLYRIVYELHEKLEWSWEERFQHKYGCFRDEVKKSFEKYLSCGIVRHGCARAECEVCGHTELIAFSCKQRFCPSCDAKRAHLFAENLIENILGDYLVSHVVFTIPKRLRVYFKYNRNLLGVLYTAAWSSWKEAVNAELPDMDTGAVAALHSAGDLLQWHPHIHNLCLSGAVDDSGNFHKLKSLDTESLTSTFSEHVFNALLERELPDDLTVESIKAWQHSGFNVWVGEPVESAKIAARKFLARYLKKSLIALPRLELIKNDAGSLVRINKVTDDGKLEFRDLEPLDFLAELSASIPDYFEQTVRYFGTFSARARGAKRLALDTPGPLPTIEPPAKPSPLWAACMKRIFELDSFLLPKCGATMKIKEFPQDETQIEKLCKNLGQSSWVPPPPLPQSKLAA